MKASFVLSKADQKLACRMMYKLQPKTGLMRVVNFCGSFVGAFLATASGIPLIRILYERASDVAEIIFCLVGVVLGVSMLIAKRLLVSNIGLNSSGVFGATYTYELLEDRIVCMRNANIRTEIYPNAILKITPTPHFIFIYTGVSYAYFIPTSAFTSSSANSEFVKRLEQIKIRTANTGIDTDAAG